MAPAPPQGRVIYERDHEPIPFDDYDILGHVLTRIPLDKSAFELDLSTICMDLKKFAHNYLETHKPSTSAPSCQVYECGVSEKRLAALPTDPYPALRQRPEEHSVPCYNDCLNRDVIFRLCCNLQRYTNKELGASLMKDSSNIVFTVRAVWICATMSNTVGVNLPRRIVCRLPETLRSLISMLRGNESHDINSKSEDDLERDGWVLVEGMGEG